MAELGDVSDVPDTDSKMEVDEKACESKEDDCAEDHDAAEESACKHYNRLCKLKAACCSKFYPCRFCHDEVSNHEMNRHMVQEIQCVKCETLQGVCNKCEKCSAVFGEYFCPVCRLYDKNKDQFHCDKCGICRVGPKEKFYHCDTCNACLSKELKGNHKCVENMSQSSCPICQEYLHTSRLGMHIPRCGHMIHQECLRSIYAQGLYQCPLCRQSLEDMSDYWKIRDEYCAAVRLPPDLQNVRLKILCQDCHKNSEVPFNTEGLKCLQCGGYNTTEV
ncbi:RING finger and CHY zinc finger domain-containing protein 1 [Aplysia californica]|uniref:RING finger and CHY zinc finger domain-containing protein 1 n=1 Tax=Aplysia californica TaxID=6500 RepID=A0ABM0JQ96_APLCA|nr:RING finger and CHY zinc finger domain-containing protein 1 [Aplysia californica]